jgi:hypothetical protein
MYASGKYANRKRADQMLAGEPVIEYPTQDTNPDDVPF